MFFSSSMFCRGTLLSSVLQRQESCSNFQISMTEHQTRSISCNNINIRNQSIARNSLTGRLRRPIGDFINLVGVRFGVFRYVMCHFYRTTDILACSRLLINLPTEVNCSDPHRINRILVSPNSYHHNLSLAVEHKDWSKYSIHASSTLNGKIKVCHCSLSMCLSPKYVVEGNFYTWSLWNDRSFIARRNFFSSNIRRQAFLPLFFRQKWLDKLRVYCSWQKDKLLVNFQGCLLCYVFIPKASLQWSALFCKAKTLCSACTPPEEVLFNYLTLLMNIRAIESFPAAWWKVCTFNPAIWSTWSSSTTLLTKTSRV